MTYITHYLQRPPRPDAPGVLERVCMSYLTHYLWRPPHPDPPGSWRESSWAIKLITCEGLHILILQGLGEDLHELYNSLPVKASTSWSSRVLERVLISLASRLPPNAGYCSSYWIRNTHSVAHEQYEKGTRNLISFFANNPLLTYRILNCLQNSNFTGIKNIVFFLQNVIYSKIAKLNTQNPTDLTFSDSRQKHINECLSNYSHNILLLLDWGLLNRYKYNL